MLQVAAELRRVGAVTPITLGIWRGPSNLLGPSERSYDARHSLDRRRPADRRLRRHCGRRSRLSKLRRPRFPEVPRELSGEPPPRGGSSQPAVEVVQHLERLRRRQHSRLHGQLGLPNHHRRRDVRWPRGTVPALLQHQRKLQLLQRPVHFDLLEPPGRLPIHRQWHRV